MVLKYFEKGQRSVNYMELLVVESLMPACMRLDAKGTNRDKYFRLDKLGDVC